MAEVTCFKCSKATEFVSRLGFREACDCSQDLHVCLNCGHYDPGAYNECKEPIADRVKEKERANFCEHFNPSQKGVDGKKAPSNQDLRAQAEALFANWPKKNET